ncbi:VOC family protein [Kocuria turfanensis]|uniref:Glyoxalase n=1 Tax=Kocuria turfanensis TaxID=388357 RepID=A0A512ID69_9MICC|nr:VOC family protein [Kocuria turfanensis]GEO95646.1 glyoxalase [Kocuria turfanensis]
MSTEQSVRGVTGAHTTDGTPHGFTSLTPFLAVVDAAAAIDFCTRVFGAVLVDRTDMPGPDGTPVVVHATLDLGNGRLQLGEVNPGFHLVPPPGGDDACYSLGLYVPDVDDVVARAVAAGATVREPVSAFVSGDRYGSIRDPFGIRWSIMTRVEDLSDEESSARVAEWAASFGQE